MHFEITASLQSLHKHLTPAQRNSSLFSESPRLAGKTLRRGQVMRLSEAEFRANEVLAKRLFDAGAIEIAMVDGDHREDLRTKGVPKPEAKKEAPKEPPPPPSAPKVEMKEELPPPPPPELVKNEAFPTPEELVAAVAAENKETEEQIEKVVETALTPAEEKVEAPSPSAPRPVVTESKGKKGKR